MTSRIEFSSNPRQRLSRDAYTSNDWFAAEREKLFSNTWQFACMEFDLQKPGDFVSLLIGDNPLAVLMDAEGELKAYHNLCRHRGTELLEGKGNTGKTIVCPYHRWTYGLDGALRGLPNRDCFADLDRGTLGLRPAAIGVFKEMVFINPDPSPHVSFEDWIGPLRSHEWPHEIGAGKLAAGEEFVYRMKCNWKVFCENALDGYHLAYLHEKTLGGPLPEKNIWEAHGQNLAWYSTERDKIRHRIPVFVENNISSLLTQTIPEAKNPGYGGVYFLFPTLLVTPSPWSLTISLIEPVSPTETILRARTWMPKLSSMFDGSPNHAPGYDDTTGEILSKNWENHPLDSGDFQTEDIWVCEKMQRSLASPKYEVGPLAAGSGAEAPVEFFQKTLLEYMK